MTGLASADQVAQWFRSEFGGPAAGVWRAPGRANLIGEHTDYNDGFVFPFALDRGTLAAASAARTGVLELASRQVGTGTVTIPLAGLAPGSADGWAAYPAGVVWALGEAGYPLPGARVAIDSDLPQGAGLSSSAALECAVALALTQLAGLSVPRPQLAAIARRAENDFVGVPTGIMDQSAALLCQAGHALLLDCCSGESDNVPLNPAAAGLALLIIDTRARHRLTDSGYAARHIECEEAARALGVRSLRDIPDAQRAGRADRPGAAPPGPARGHREPAGAGHGRAAAPRRGGGRRAAAERVARLAARRFRDLLAGGRCGGGRGGGGGRAGRADDGRRVRRVGARPRPGGLRGGARRGVRGVPGPGLARAGLPGRSPVGQRAAAVVTGVGALPGGSVREDAAAIAADLAELRHRIHREPEIGLDLPQTQQKVLGALDGLPLEVTVGRALSSVTAVLRGGQPGPTVLLRGDMDALPITERTGLDYASAVTGVMHACGHDLHTAMLAGAARVLSARQDELPGQRDLHVPAG